MANRLVDSEILSVEGGSAAIIVPPTYILPAGFLFISVDEEVSSGRGK